MRQPCVVYSDFNPLALKLLSWAAKNLPEAFDSVADNLDKREHCFRCIGALFRAAVAADSQLLWRTVDEHPTDLLALSRYIDHVGFLPGRMGWKEWIRCAGIANAGFFEARGVLREPTPKPMIPEQPKTKEELLFAK